MQGMGEQAVAVYVFSLLARYAPNGIHYSQGYRARIFKGLPYSVWYIFTEMPRRSDISFYKKLGIAEENMVSMHHYFLDHPGLRLSVRITDKLEELERDLKITDTIVTSSEIQLMKNGSVVAVLVPDSENREYLLEVRYFNKSRLARTEVYTDQLAYADYYVTAEVGRGVYGKRTRRVYYHSNGSIAYEQLFDRDDIHYLLPDGRILTESEFVTEFIRKLSLSEEDIALIDRFAQCGYVQPLFQEGRKAKMIAVMHGGHYFAKGESAYTVNFNQDYNYLMRYTGMVDVIVVSTQEQKEDLTDKLREYGRSVPEIRVIPAGGVDKLRYPDAQRKPCSILSVSRIQMHKRIHWIIRSVIKAHQINDKITLDVYGSGNTDYTNTMKEMVAEYQAQPYIRFMGHRDVTEIYKEYELFITASTFETLGLSIMEAVSSGDAVIGLTAKYGSRLLIHPEENGYLIDFAPNCYEEEEDRIINDMARRILDVFEERERLYRFQEHSYEIARGFSERIVKEKWRALLQEILQTGGEAGYAGFV